MVLITSILYGFTNGPPKNHQGCTKGAARVHQVFTKGLPRVNPPRIHQGCSNGSPRVHQLYIKGPSHLHQFFYICAMLSALDTAKRSLVKLVRATPTKYQAQTSVSRESFENDVTKAFRAFNYELTLTRVATRRVSRS